MIEDTMDIKSGVMDLIYISREPRNHPTKVNLRRKMRHLRQPPDSTRMVVMLLLHKYPIK